MMTEGRCQLINSSIDLPVEKKYFSVAELINLKPHMVPKHVAIIPDGNRRWADRQNFNGESGHRQGADSLITIVKAAKELGVKVITFYLFSTENWLRSQQEVNALMWILYDLLIDRRSEMIEQGIKVDTIGNLDRLPEYVKHTIQETKKVTSHCDQIEMVMALNYGGRDEICRAIRSIVSDCENKKINKEEISEELIGSYLDTATWGDPDLLIRAGGEMRISNYLLWQISYSEVYLTDVLWPDFKPSHLLAAIMDFQTRQRRLGRI